MLLLKLLVAIYFVSNAVLATDTNNSFIYPPPQDLSNPSIVGSYAIGDFITTQWLSDWAEVDLYICQNGTGLTYTPDSTAGSLGQWQWQVNPAAYGFNLSKSHTFYWTVEQTGTNESFSSQFVDFTASAISSSDLASTSSKAPSPSSGSIDPTLTKTPVVATTPTMSPSIAASSISLMNSASKSQLLSSPVVTSASSSTAITTQAAHNIEHLTSTKIAIGAGAGAGGALVALIVALGVWYGISRCKKAPTAKATAAQKDSSNAVFDGMDMPQLDSTPIYYPPRPMGDIYELPSV